MLVGSSVGTTTIGVAAAGEASSTGVATSVTAVVTGVPISCVTIETGVASPLGVASSAGVASPTTAVAGPVTGVAAPVATPGEAAGLATGEAAAGGELLGVGVSAVSAGWVIAGALVGVDGGACSPQDTNTSAAQAVTAISCNPGRVGRRSGILGLFVVDRWTFPDPRTAD